MIKFTAKIQNQENQHSVSLQTGNHVYSIEIAPKAGGFGSKMNGGEALVLAIATCYCNDIYREAKQLGITVHQVNIDVDGHFDGQAGHIIEDIVYHVTVEADAHEDEIEKLIRHTDTVAEIHNTLRQGTKVSLGEIKAISGK